MTEKLRHHNSGSVHTAYVYLLLTFFLWGSLYVVSKFVLGKLPPFTLAFVRFLLAFAALSVIDMHPQKKLDRKHYPYVLLIGFGGYFISVGAQLLGTKYAGASVASLLNSMNPVTMTATAMAMPASTGTFKRNMVVVTMAQQTSRTAQQNSILRVCGLAA